MIDDPHQQGSDECSWLIPSAVPLPSFGVIERWLSKLLAHKNSVLRLIRLFHRFPIAESLATKLATEDSCLKRWREPLNDEYRRDLNDECRSAVWPAVHIPQSFRGSNCSQRIATRGVNQVATFRHDLNLSLTPLAILANNSIEYLRQR